MVAKVLLEGGSDLMQRDSKGNLPIYSAARDCNDTLREGLLNLLLHPRWVDHQDGLLESIPQDNIPQDQEWWNGYYRFIRQPAWSNPSHLLEMADLMPKDVGEVISTTALAIAAKPSSSQPRPVSTPSRKHQVCISRLLDARESR